MNTDISVVIPAYNAAAYIAETIESVIRQTVPAKEILIINDGSTDNTAEVVKQFLGKVELIQLENSGVSHARNVGFERATSDWVAFLDSDDTWHEDKLKVCVRATEQTPDCSFLFSDFRSFGSESAVQKLQEGFQLWQVSEHLLVPLVCVLPSASVVRKGVDSRFPEWAGNNCEDAIYFNDLSDEGEVIHIPEVLVNYRRHQASAQKQDGSRQRGCENLWKRYSASAADRKRLMNTFIELAIRKRDSRNWVAFEYFCTFLTKHWPQELKKPLWLRCGSRLRPIYQAKDVVDRLSGRFRTSPDHNADPSSLIQNS